MIKKPCSPYNIPRIRKRKNLFSTTKTEKLSKKQKTHIASEFHRNDRVVLLGSDKDVQKFLKFLKF